MLDLTDPTLDDAAVPPLPLPDVVDTPAVVLTGLLAGGTRPLVIDAVRVRDIHPAAAQMLLSLLRAKRDAGAEARIIAATPGLRRRLAAHPLAAFFSDAPAAGGSAEALFTCPDREELGFLPSAR